MARGAPRHCAEFWLYHGELNLLQWHERGEDMRELVQADPISGSKN